MQHDNNDPHMKGTPQLSLQSFSLFQQMMINTNYNSKPFNPALTSLEEAAWALFIQKTGDLAQGGHKPQGDKPL